MKDCATGIVFNADQSLVLLIKRRDIPIWVLPGGGIDPTEDPADATIREVFEESGFHVKIIRKTGEYAPINRLAALTHVYECQVIDGDLNQTDESLEVGFFSIHQLPPPFFELHADWLKDALENQTQVIYKPITQVTYWKLFRFFLKHPILVIRAILARFGMPINS